MIFFQTWYSGNFPVTSTRLVLNNSQAPLMASFHLPSQKFEWIQLIEPDFETLRPVATNSRYLVNKANNNAVLFDFCS